MGLCSVRAFLEAQPDAFDLVIFCVFPWSALAAYDLLMVAATQDIFAAHSHRVLCVQPLYFPFEARKKSAKVAADDNDEPPIEKRKKKKKKAQE